MRQEEIDEFARLLFERTPDFVDPMGYVSSELERMPEGDLVATIDGMIDFTALAKLALQIANRWNSD